LECGIQPFFLFLLYVPLQLCSPLFPFLLLLPIVLLSTRKTVAAGGGGEDGLCSWWCYRGWEEDGGAVLSVGWCLAAAFFASVEVQAPVFL